MARPRGLAVTGTRYGNASGLPVQPTGGKNTKDPSTVDGGLRDKEFKELCERIGRTVASRYKTLRQCFLNVDRSRDGMLDRDEMRRLFLNWNLPREYADRLFDFLDSNRNGEIDFAELRTHLGPYIQPGLHPPAPPGAGSASTRGAGTPSTRGQKESKGQRQCDAELLELCQLLADKAYQKRRTFIEAFRFLDPYHTGLVSRGEGVRLVESLTLPRATAHRVFDLIAGDTKAKSVSYRRFVETLGPFIRPGYANVPGMNRVRRREEAAPASPEPSVGLFLRQRPSSARPPARAPTPPAAQACAGTPAVIRQRPASARPYRGGNDARLPRQRPASARLSRPATDVAVARSQLTASDGKTGGRRFSDNSVSTALSENEPPGSADVGSGSGSSSLSLGDVNEALANIGFRASAARGFRAFGHRCEVLSSTRGGNFSFVPDEPRKIRHIHTLESARVRERIQQFSSAAEWPPAAAPLATAWQGLHTSRSWHGPLSSCRSAPHINILGRDDDPGFGDGNPSSAGNRCRLVTARSARGGSFGFVPEGYRSLSTDAFSLIHDSSAMRARLEPNSSSGSSAGSRWRSSSWHGPYFLQSDPQREKHAAHPRPPRMPKPPGGAPRRRLSVSFRP